MAKCTFWYQLTRVVPDKVQRAAKWLCVCVSVCVRVYTSISVLQGTMSLLAHTISTSVFHISHLVLSLSLSSHSNIKLSYPFCHLFLQCYILHLV